MKKMFRVILAFLFGSQAMAQKGQDEGINVLFVGNSYTHMNEMPSIFDKIAKSKGKVVHVEKNTRSGASFNVHTTRPDLFEAINSRKWDYVVLQGYSREMSYPPAHLDTATVPYIQLIIDSIRNNNPCTNILLHMTWGYKEGFEEREEIDTYTKMSDVIAEGYQYLSDTLKIPIVPVGKVWKEVRANFPDIEMYDADKQHPSKNGSYTSASTFFAAIFKESPEKAITGTISNTSAAAIQKTAGDYVLKNFDRFSLNQDFNKITSKITKEGAFVINGVANFPKADSISWDFGDGNSALKNKVTHTYKSEGIYPVVLTVNDECGVREIRKTVKFTEPKGPTPVQKTTLKKGNSPKKRS